MLWNNLWSQIPFVINFSNQGSCNLCYCWSNCFAAFTHPCQVWMWGKKWGSKLTAFRNSGNKGKLKQQITCNEIIVNTWTVFTTCNSNRYRRLRFFKVKLNFTLFGCYHQITFVIASEIRIKYDITHWITLWDFFFNTSSVTACWFYSKITCKGTKNTLKMKVK